MRALVVAIMAGLVAMPQLGHSQEPPPVSYSDQDQCLTALPEAVHSTLVILRRSDPKADSRVITADTMAANAHFWLDRGRKRPDGKPWAVMSVVKTCHIGVMITKTFFVTTPEP